jgi:hypothetical protein
MIGTDPLVWTPLHWGQLARMAEQDREVFLRLTVEHPGPERGLHYEGFLISTRRTPVSDVYETVALRTSTGRTELTLPLSHPVEALLPRSASEPPAREPIERPLPGRTEGRTNGRVAPEPEETWRVGRSYDVHVYAVGPTSPHGDRPVATFTRPEDARRAVDATARLAAVREVVAEAETLEVIGVDGQRGWQTPAMREVLDRLNDALGS